MLLYLIATVLLVISLIWSRRKPGLPPGPWCLPIVGYLPWLSPEAPHENLTNLSKKYGPIYGLYLGSVYTVVLSDYKMVRKVLAKDVTTGRAPLYLTHGIMNGYGLICAEKDLWKDQRKFVSGCLKQFGVSKFGSKREKIESLIMKEVIDFVDYVKNINENKSEIQLDPLEPLRHNVGSAVNHLVFGKSWPRDSQLWQWLQHLQEEGTKSIGVAGPLNFLPFLRFVPKFKSTMTFLLDGKKKTHEVYQQIIDERADILEKCDGDFQAENIIDAFLVEKKKRSADDVAKFYNDEQFFHLLADLFGAGLDTTLTTLRWYFLYMACNPDIQTKVQEEIDVAVQNRYPNVDDLSTMPFTEASLAEAQRIRSVVPVGIPHGTLDETEIGGYNVPKGTMVVPLQWAIHMNPNTWKEPETFNPLRFLDEEGRLVKDEAFIPFQTGKRMCVGDEFARMLLFLFGVTILQQFNLSIPENTTVDLRGESGITLTPKPQKLVFSIRNV